MLLREVDADDFPDTGPESPPGRAGVTTDPVSAPAMLPGSRADYFQLLLCGKCKRPQERSGGVISVARFVCRACFNSRDFKSASPGQR